MSAHVFLSHSTADKPAVEALAHRLGEEGIQAWLDKWHLIPGDPWQPAIETALAESQTCAVFIGTGGLGPWQHEEMRAAIARRVSESGKQFRVIPVLLPGAKPPKRRSLPPFLVAATWVEFRGSLHDTDAFHRLVCGIRGVAPGPRPRKYAPVSPSRPVHKHNRHGVQNLTLLKRDADPERLTEPMESFDVFLSHSHVDGEIVESLGQRLADEAKFRVWLDRWILVPGCHWQQEMAKGLDQAKSCAACIGRKTPKGWFREEIERALNRQNKDDSFRVIPVILPGGDRSLIDSFLELRTWVDFSKGLEDEYVFYVLTCGIKGIAPGRNPFQANKFRSELSVVRDKLEQIRTFRREQLIDDAIAIEFQRRLLDKIFGS